MPGPGPRRGRRAGKECRAHGSQAHCQLCASVSAELCRLEAGRTRQGVGGPWGSRGKNAPGEVRGKALGRGWTWWANSVEKVRVMHPNSRGRGCPWQARATCSLNSEDGHVMWEGRGAANKTHLRAPAQSACVEPEPFPPCERPGAQSTHLSHSPPPRGRRSPPRCRESQPVSWAPSESGRRAAG